MVGGRFEMLDDLPGRQMVEGKYNLAPLYMVELNTELVSHVGEDTNHYRQEPSLVVRKVETIYFFTAQNFRLWN